MLILNLAGLVAFVVAPLLVGGVFWDGILGSRCRVGPIDTTVMIMSKVQQRVELYRLRKGRYPATLEQLFVGERPPFDAWGRPLVYVTDPTGQWYDIVSLGDDGQTGGFGEDGDLLWTRVR